MKILALVDRDALVPQKKNTTLEQLSKAAATSGASLAVSRFADVEFFVDRKDVIVMIKGTPLSEYSAVYFRHVGKYKSVASLIGLMCDSISIPFVDTLYRHTIGTGKIDQTIRLSHAHVSVPKSYFTPTTTQESLERAVAFLGSPLILKDSSGRLGANVFLVRSIEEIEKIIGEQKKAPKEWLFQEFIPNTFDYRILTLGGEAIIAEKRERTNNEEFRNNVSLGAKEHFIPVNEVPQDILDLARTASHSLQVEVAGVDIVTDSNTGHSFVLEVNRCPGFTHEGNSGEVSALAHFLFSLCQKK